jgi:tripeptide aminopeptidase
MLDRSALSNRTFEHLRSVVRMESASDETSATIPSTQGQIELGQMLEQFFVRYGATVEIDRHGNVIASFSGRGDLAGHAPLALMVHLDTARGTQPTNELCVIREWDGGRVPYPRNESIDVTIANYPWLEQMRGLDIVHGPGDAPFGLDDKLGMAHLMTVATLAAETDRDHVPFFIVCRPDEEIGRHEALEDLAGFLADRGVRHGYTIDGLDPYEVNLENFNASVAEVRFDHAPATVRGLAVRAVIGGVNTHGATAKAEQHRTALRFVGEVVDRLDTAEVEVIRFSPDPLRDCDAIVEFSVASETAADALEGALHAVIGPHIRRGASLANERLAEATSNDASASAAVRWAHAFGASDPGFLLRAEESDGHDGYSHPFRIRPVDGGNALDIRIRDFQPSGLEAREAHIRKEAGSRNHNITRQYVNMGPEIAKEACLKDWALEAGRRVGVESEIRPIRGGTGVDPLLDRGVYVANVGTGYFAPESEKELTCLQWMGGHAAWIFELLTVA